MTRIPESILPKTRYALAAAYSPPTPKSMAERLKSAGNLPPQDQELVSRYEADALVLNDPNFLASLNAAYERYLAILQAPQNGKELLVHLEKMGSTQALLLSSDQGVVLEFRDRPPGPIDPNLALRINEVYGRFQKASNIAAHAERLFIMSQSPDHELTSHEVGLGLGGHQSPFNVLDPVFAQQVEEAYGRHLSSLYGDIMDFTSAIASLEPPKPGLIEKISVGAATNKRVPAF